MLQFRAVAGSLNKDEVESIDKLSREVDNLLKRRRRGVSWDPVYEKQLILKKDRLIELGTKHKKITQLLSSKKDSASVTAAISDKNIFSFFITGASFNSSSSDEREDFVSSCIMNVFSKAPKVPKSRFVQNRNESLNIEDTKPNRNILAEAEDVDDCVFSSHQDIRIKFPSSPDSIKQCPQKALKIGASTTSISHVRFSNNDKSFRALYYSPYLCAHGGHLCLCPLCLSESCVRCKYSTSPPGTEIYIDGNIRVFEIDGAVDEMYCQNLNLLGRLFIGSKTATFCAKPFRYYVLYDLIDGSYHFVGYFSKLKDDTLCYNLSCLLTYPAYEKKKAGWFLVDLSYELSKREGKVGSPEAPNAHAQKLYTSFISHAICKQILTNQKEVCLDAMAYNAGIEYKDVVGVMSKLNKVSVKNGNAVVKLPKEYVKKNFEEIERKLSLPGCFRFKSNLLTWHPERTLASAVSLDGNAIKQSTR